MKRNQISQFVVVLLCFLVSATMFSQRGDGGITRGDLTIGGPTTVNINETHTYMASSSATIFSGTWTAVGATVLSQNTTSISLKWTSSGFKTIEYTASTSSGTLEAFHFVTVNGATAPPIPSNPTVSSQNCSSATLSRGTPPSGVTWYWQGTNSSGTSTSNSNTTYTATSNGRYYIRARNSSGVWSTGSGYVDITLGTVGGATWYADSDGDGLGDAGSTIVQCTQPSGYVSNSSDQCPTVHGGGTATGCPSGSGLSDENYVYTIAPQKPVTSTTGLTQTKDAIRSITYFDGLGRAKQSIGIKQSNNEKDIVTHIAYDNLGRQVKEYLPYAASSAGGYIKTDALTATNTYYKTHYAADVDVNNPNPYSEKVFDGSPLNRVVEQTAPGEDWKKGTTYAPKGYTNGSHSIKFEHDNNTGTEVREYYVTTTVSGNTYVPTLQLNTASSNNHGYYLQGVLYKTITKDENWEPADGVNHTTEEFKNKQGQVVLKRTYNAGQKHDTYYVYDDFGNLTFVLPPKSEATTAKPDAVELSELCYQYTYDDRNRLVEKKIPGKDKEYIIYDRLDRPVLTQDANLRGSRKWMFTKYDQLGRVVYTGIYVHGTTLSQSQMQSHVDAVNNTPAEYYETKLTSSGSLGIYYSNSDFPTTSLDVLTVNYYDNYTFNRAGAATSVSNVYGVNSTTRLQGLVTGSRVKVLGTVNWITTVSYYDDKARPIYVYTKNDELKTTDIIKSDLDFVGRVEETTSLHTKTDDSLPTLTVIDKFTYDHAGRLVQHTQQGTNISGIEVVVYNTYDGLGQLQSKGVGGKTTQSRLQTVDYSYNIRGWLKKINQDTKNDNDLFNFSLKYNDPTSGTALYNGNISQTSWNTLNTDTSSKTYTYSYDALNRIESAIDNLNRYSLSNVDYDKNGNITKLERRGHIVANPNKNYSTHFGLMDNLQYGYSSRSNKLTSVQELSGGNATYGFKNGANTSTEYTYDANGNMKTDANKGITNITYNYLNLPTQVTIGGQNINYTYDAAGVKQKKIVGGITTEYAGNYIYENKNLQFFNQPEGYVKNDGGSFKYIYQYKDHLGNVRLSYTDHNNNGSIAASTEIVEESNYYPFGLEHKGYNGNYNPIGNAKAQKFGFTGKEHQDELDLGWIDVTARNYDAALGRWMNLDPVSEFYYDYSPFIYGGNNPLLYTDPNGLWIVNIVASTNKGGETTYSLSFTAEKGDDLNSLSNQLGISEEDILKKHSELKGKTISEGDSFGLGKLKEVKKINKTINKVAKKQDSWNCANFACGSDRTIKSQWDNPGNNVEDLVKILQNKYSSVSESSSKIGTIVHYKLNNALKTKKYVLSEYRKQLKSQGFADAQIDAYLNSPQVQTQMDNIAKALVADERHFSIVVLKNKSGTRVQSIVQKSGKEHFKFKVDDAKNVHPSLPYTPVPIGGTNNPYYNK